MVQHGGVTGRFLDNLQPIGVTALQGEAHRLLQPVTDDQVVQRVAHRLPTETAKPQTIIICFHYHNVSTSSYSDFVFNFARIYGHTTSLWSHFHSITILSQFYHDFIIIWWLFLSLWIFHVFSFFRSRSNEKKLLLFLRRPFCYWRFFIHQTEYLDYWWWKKRKSFPVFSLLTTVCFVENLVETIFTKFGCLFECLFESLFNSRVIQTNTSIPLFCFEWIVFCWKNWSILFFQISRKLFPYPSSSGWTEQKIVAFLWYCCLFYFEVTNTLFAFFIFMERLNLHLVFCRIPLWCFINYVLTWQKCPNRRGAKADRRLRRRRRYFAPRRHDRPRVPKKSALVLNSSRFCRRQKWSSLEWRAYTFARSTSACRESEKNRNADSVLREYQ